MQKKKGFTLIELIVAMVLATMLLGALIPLLVTAQKSTYDAQKKTRAAQAGEAIYTYVAAQLRSAERVFIGQGATAPTDPPAAQWNQITVQGGKLTVNGVTPYPESYQEGEALTLEALGHDRTVLDLTVRLGGLYEKSSSINLQNVLRSGFSQTEGTVGQALSAPAAAGGAALTIYYLGGDGSIDVFPTPENPTPDDSRPDPAGDTLTVTILNKSLRVKPGETATVRAYVHVPAGKTADFTWSQGPAGYLVFTETETPVTGALNASGTVTMKLKAQKATEENTPVTVVLRATLNGAGEAAQDTCAVTVYETESAMPSDGLILHYANTPTGDAYNDDIAQQTVFWNIQDYAQGFTLTVAQKDGSLPLTGEWSIVEADSEATRQSFQQFLPSSGAHSYHYQGQPPKGWVTIKVKVAEKGNDNAPTDLIGEWTNTTLVLYDAGDYTLTAKLAGSSAADGKSLTVNYPEGKSATEVVGMPAATATLTVSPQNSQAREILKKFLPMVQGELVTKDWNLWPDNSLFNRPVATSTFVEQPGGSFQCTFSLTYQRAMNDWSKTEEVSFYGRLTDAVGKEFLQDAALMKVTVQKPEVPLPMPGLIFRDNQQSVLAVDYRKGARVVAELQFTFTGKDAESNATSFLGNQAAIYSDAIGAWPDDPLVKQPLTYSPLAVKDGEKEGEYVLYATFSLQLARHPKQDTEKMAFIASVLTDQSKMATAMLTVNDSKNEMVLRLDQGDGTGMIVSGQTLLLDPAFDGLYLSAYENETSTVPLTDGRWGKESRNHGLLTYISNRWVSEPQITSFYYNDKQNSSSEKREPKQWKDYLFLDWARSKCWSDYNWANLVYTAQDGTKAFTTVKVQNTSQRYDTKLTAEPLEVTVGTDVELALHTTYEKNAAYKVVWAVDNTDLFECPAEASYRTDGNGQDTRKLTLQPATGAKTDIPTTVTVTATWESDDGEGSLFGQRRLTITVQPRENKLQRQINGRWVTAETAGELVIASSGFLPLRVVDETGMALAGTWSVNGPFQQNQEAGNIEILQPQASGTVGQVGFQPKNTAYPKMAFQVRVSDDGTGDFLIHVNNEVEKVAITKQNTPVSMVGSDIYTKNGYAPQWYIRKEGETDWQLISMNNGGGTTYETLTLKPTATDGSKAQITFEKGAVTGEQYELYLSYTNAKTGQTVRSQILGVYKN